VYEKQFDEYEKLELRHLQRTGDLYRRVRWIA